MEKLETPISSGLQGHMKTTFLHGMVVDKMVLKFSRLPDLQLLKKQAYRVFKNHFESTYREVRTYQYWDIGAVTVVWGPRLPGQIWYGKIEFNPRRFNCLNHVRSFLRSIGIDLTNTEVSRMDFTWIIQKRLFGWKWFFTRTKVKGARVFEREDYGFWQGKNPKRLSVYEDGDDTHFELQLSNNHCPMRSINSNVNKPQFRVFEESGLELLEFRCDILEDLNESMLSSYKLRKLSNAQKKKLKDLISLKASIESFGLLPAYKLFNKNQNFERDYALHLVPPNDLCVSELDKMMDESLRSFGIN